ncbi:MAG TPA: hypothetical protein VGX69_08065 [Solirubrobacteraceae bacterium]|nr:hypothetical protein [Solirubrobacteraceae bacterium]
MRPTIAIRRPHRRPLVTACAVLLAAAVACGCGASRPRTLDARELAEAQTFPYFRVYWTGPTFLGHPPTAADGQKGYISSVGDSVYYGDCVHGKGIFGGGSCVLPLQVTTVIYALHSNGPLGSQRNIVVRGVPATVYDEGRSIELYTGRVAIDIFSDTYAHALAAARLLLPLNAPGAASGNLPPPVFCPGLSGPQDASVRQAMEALPGRACQRASASLALAKSVFES